MINACPKLHCVADDYIDSQKIYHSTSLPLIVARAIGLLKDLWFKIGTFYSRIEASKNYDKLVGTVEKAKVIAVLIHGLHGHPSQMDGHAKAIKEQFKEDVVVYQMHVNKQGNCPKHEAVSQIASIVFPMLKKHPHLKLYASGISNGGWLAARLAIDALEENIEGRRILVHANSAPFFGTKRICDPAIEGFRERVWKWLIKRIMANIVYEDFTWGSKAGKEIIEKIRVAATKGVKFEFDGSFADVHVTPPSFYPKNVPNAEYFYPESIEGHSSIIVSQRARQVNSLKLFLN